MNHWKTALHNLQFEVSYEAFFELKWAEKSAVVW